MMVKVMVMMVMVMMTMMMVMVMMVLVMVMITYLSNGRLQDGQSPGPGELTALLTVFRSGEIHFRLC